MGSFSGCLRGWNISISFVFCWAPILEFKKTQMTWNAYPWPTYCIFSACHAHSWLFSFVWVQSNYPAEDATSRFQVGSSGIWTLGISRPWWCFHYSGIILCLHKWLPADPSRYHWWYTRSGAWGWEAVQSFWPWRRNVGMMRPRDRWNPRPTWVSINGGTPRWMVYNVKSHWNGWFGGILSLGNLHMGPWIAIFYRHVAFQPSGYGRVWQGLFQVGRWFSDRLRFTFPNIRWRFHFSEAFLLQQPCPWLLVNSHLPGEGC